MAGIGALSMGGRGPAPGTPAVFGVAFDLTRNPAADFLYRSDGWEIELKAGQGSVVARTTERLERSALLSAGLEHAQRCLDIVAYETRSDALLANPSDTHALLFPREDALVLQYADVSSIGVGFNATFEVRDAHGNIREQPVRPPAWTPGLRFYRLSQASRDLYEAYRNLFLGLEALLDELCAKGRNEGERVWLLRALSTIAPAAGLQGLVPEGTADSAAFIVKEQYDRIRLRLFHAKGSVTGKALDLPDPEEVGSAYERLIRIWRQIAERCLSVRSGGGGAMTYAGFKMMMDGTLSSGLTMYMTEDDSPFNKQDSALSPLGKPLRSFHETRYVGETIPGRVALLGSFAPAAGDNPPIVHRIGVSNDRSVLLVSVITAGLEISGVDVFESIQTIRLRNLGLPKTIFGADPD